MCNPSCKTCSGPSATECVECKSGLLVQLDKTCQQGCPSNAFIKDNIKCEKCHPTCSSCQDAEDVDCTSCLSGLYMLPSKKCDSTIPKGHFLDGKEVVKCHDSCETCNGVGPTNVCHALHQRSSDSIRNLNALTAPKTISPTKKLAPMSSK
jgi:proprotein convertase subtilisin/kexin type 5